MPTPTAPRPDAPFAAFEPLSEGVLWVEVSGKLHHANTAAARLLGYAPADLLRHSYLEIDPNYSLLGWKRFWKRLPDGAGEFLDTQFVNAAGGLFGVRGHVVRTAGPAGQALCQVAFTSTEDGRREADLLTVLEDHARTAVWEYSLSTGQVYLSARLREWLGWSPERDFYPATEFVGRLAEALTPGHRAAAAATLETLTAAARPFELELALGGAAPVELYLRGQSVANELEVHKIYGTAVRAADRPTAAVPGATHAAYPFTLDQATDAVFWIDPTELRVTYANARACETTGYDRRELTGLPLARLFPADLAPVLRLFVDEATQEHFRTLETEAQRKDGSPYPTRATLHRYTGADGGEMLVLLSRDASREQQDREDRQLYTTTLDSLQEWVVWLAGDHRVVKMNAAARRKLGRRTTRPLRGLPIGELMPGLDVPPLTRVRQEQLDGRARADVDYPYAGPDGKTRTLQIRFVPVTANSQLFLSVVCRDVTTELNNKRRLQEAKRRVDELRRQLESENEVLREEIGTVQATGPIITVSPKYKRILGQIGQVAGTDATVLVTGETGTGKELLAQSIHNFSLRSARRMVSVNCAALPENLIESELFGHERGAFTGAFAQKKGKFELADGSTIFLDEIGELPLDMQAKLLRALQEGEIQRIGSSDVINVDVRVVAATNRDLERMISEGTFREDLFYRLNVFPIHNLPLRERPEDIPVLVKHFTRQYAQKMGRPVSQIDPRDLAKLQDYAFPGNVRELINLVERAVITSTDSTLNLGTSLRVLRRATRSDGVLSLSPTDPLVSFEEMQRQYIREALRRSKGKVTGKGGAAEALDINGRTLLSKMHKLGIDAAEFRR